MQTLYPVSAEETLIDQGCYYYYRAIDGELEKMPVVEPWTRHQTLAGEIITRAERDSRH